jgi:hypothetical protein
MVNIMINPCVFGGAQCLNLTQGIKSEAALDLGCIQNFCTDLNKFVRKN